MKKAILIVMFCAALTATAQPAAEKPAEPTVSALKVKIAEQAVEIAQLRQQLIQAQAQLLQLAHGQNETELKSAQDALKAVQAEQPKK